MIALVFVLLLLFFLVSNIESCPVTTITSSVTIPVVLTATTFKEEIESIMYIWTNEKRTLRQDLQDLYYFEETSSQRDRYRGLIDRSSSIS